MVIIALNYYNYKYPEHKMSRNNGLLSLLLVLQLVIYN